MTDQKKETRIPQEVLSAARLRATLNEDREIESESQREKRNLFLIDICTKSVEIDSTISKRERETYL